MIHGEAETDAADDLDDGSGDATAAVAVSMVISVNPRSLTQSHNSYQ